MKKPVCYVIPAVKKRGAFADDLVKKLAGISLVQRSIDKVCCLVAPEHVWVVTDSEEIGLIAERSNVNCCYWKDILADRNESSDGLVTFLGNLSQTYRDLIVISPYTPLVTSDDISNAYSIFRSQGGDVLVTLREKTHRIYRPDLTDFRKFLLEDNADTFHIESRAIFIFRSELLGKEFVSPPIVCPHILGENAIEIENYRDWWICEKLIERKRIVFRVIGYSEVGMGHIFRSLSLAHEITDHEVIFVCDEQSSIAVNKIAGYDYLIKIFQSSDIEDRIIELHPDLVINDILDTSARYVNKLRKLGIKVINFEDLGSGAALANLTINELYDASLFSGSNVRWGHHYFFLRDEFNSAPTHKFQKKIDAVLLTFGGTDQNNLTLKTLRAIVDCCRCNGIKIKIVTGDGYAHKKELATYLETLQNITIEFTCATGIMSRIMEKVQVAITSNGRTVYELAHMNIPAIIISHHEREDSHLFGSDENGFINLGLYRKKETEQDILRAFERLISDIEYRRTLFDRVRRHNFSKSKERVIRLIKKVLE